MFEDLYDANQQFQGLLAELWKIWEADVARAVLLARWYWQSLPVEIVQQGKELARLQSLASQQPSSDRRIEDQVAVQLGAMGIFPAAGSGGPHFSGVFDPNPTRTLFITMMGMIREHRGDPPASAEVVPSAELVLRGQLDPVNAMVLSLPPQARQEMVAGLQALQMMSGDDTTQQFLRLSGILLAASALPRDRIPALIPGLAAPEQQGAEGRDGA